MPVEFYGEYHGKLIEEFIDSHFVSETLKQAKDGFVNAGKIYEDVRLVLIPRELLGKIALPDAPCPVDEDCL